MIPDPIAEARGTAQLGRDLARLIAEDAAAGDPHAQRAAAEMAIFERTRSEAAMHRAHAARMIWAEARAAAAERDARRFLLTVLLAQLAAFTALFLSR